MILQLLFTKKSALIDENERLRAAAARLQQENTALRNIVEEQRRKADKQRTRIDKMQHRIDRQQIIIYRLKAQKQDKQ